MPLDLPNGTACFVDSNILYYALVPTAAISEQCLKLIDRAIAGQVSLSVSIPVLSDAVHKVMISEAAQMAGRDRAGLVGYLGKHPELISRLVEYPKAMERACSGSDGCATCGRSVATRSNSSGHSTRHPHQRCDDRGAHAAAWAGPPGQQ